MQRAVKGQSCAHGHPIPWGLIELHTLHPQGVQYICLGPEAHRSPATVTVAKFSLQISPFLQTNLYHNYSP